MKCNDDAQLHSDNDNDNLFVIFSYFSTYSNDMPTTLDQKLMTP